MKPVKICGCGRLYNNGQWGRVHPYLRSQVEAKKIQLEESICPECRLDNALSVIKLARHLESHGTTCEKVTPHISLTRRKSLSKSPVLVDAKLN
jgi:hypothetical protein